MIVPNLKCQDLANKVGLPIQIGIQIIIGGLVGEFLLMLGHAGMENMTNIIIFGSV